MDEAVADGAELHAAAQGRLADLYRRHAADAARLAYVLTGDASAAEDLMQEAFVRLARRLVHLRDPDAAGAYLRRTIVNLANSRYRRRRLERAHLESVGRDRPGTAALPDIATRLVLREAILRLPMRQRTAVTLRYGEDRSEREIAELLGCRVGAAKALIHRAMESLRTDVGGIERP